MVDVKRATRSWQTVGQPSHTRGHVITDFASPSLPAVGSASPHPEPTQLCVSAHASMPEVGILQTRCLYARLRRRTAASSGPPGRVASCLILTAYPPAVYVPLDLQVTTVHDCGSATRLFSRASYRAALLHLPIVANAHVSGNSLMTRLTLSRAYPTVRCSCCHSL